jgi:hypothetical protein
MRNTSYETDFYGWANEQAALLRSGRLSEADIANIAEEIESLGKSEKRELVSRLTVLLMHLLKWKYQPLGRSSSWETTIKLQRNDIVDHMADNPSLQPLVPEAMAKANRNAVLSAADETKLPHSIFPKTCEWSFDQVVDPGFWPD